MKPQRIDVLKGNGRKVSVFASPGRFWKTRWVAFPECDQFKYHKGERDEVFKWAVAYIDGKV
jgi:hypothetical protein